jgi:hypothetical protein
LICQSLPFKAVPRLFNGNKSKSGEKIAMKGANGS